MGYLVITHVEKLSEARHLIAATPGGIEHEDAIQSARVVGVYRMPDRDEPVCPGISGGCRKQGWTRARRGYMVHACGLRNRDYRSKFAVMLMDWLGINLLPRERTPGMFRNPEGWDKK